MLTSLSLVVTFLCVSDRVREGGREFLLKFCHLMHAHVCVQFSLRTCNMRILQPSQSMIVDRKVKSSSKVPHCPLANVEV